jgi:hypothetical protein
LRLVAATRQERRSGNKGNDDNHVEAHAATTAKSQLEERNAGRCCSGTVRQRTDPAALFSQQGLCGAAMSIGTAK